MTTKQSAPLLELYFSRWVAILPLLFFVVPLIWMTFTGWGRIFEGKDGKVIEGSYMNDVPEEAMKQVALNTRPAQ